MTQQTIHLKVSLLPVLTLPQIPDCGKEMPRLLVGYLSVGTEDDA